MKTCNEICKGCGAKFGYEFTRKSKKFCTPKCESDYFNHKNHPKTTYPKYRCEKCGDIQLDFYPTKDITQFEAFIKSHKCKNYE